MPEIPVYHSQGTPPETSRLPMADPGIVGGEPILQGAQRLQQSLLHLFSVQAQADQADQVTLAGEIYGQAKMQLVKKKQELLARQQESPVNPMEHLKEYGDTAKQVYEWASQHPALAGKPLAQKYMATHVGTAIAGSVDEYADEQGKAWVLWKRAETDKVLNGIGETSIDSPGDLAQARAILDAAKVFKTYGPKEAEDKWESMRNNTYERRAINFARANAPEWDAARRKGELPKEYKEGKFLDVGALARVDAAARAELGYRRQEETQQREDAQRQVAALQSKFAAQAMERFFANKADPKNPPVTERYLEGLVSVDKNNPVPRITDETARALYQLIKADEQHAESSRLEDNYLAVYKRVTLPWGHPDKITRPEEVLPLATEERDGVVTRKLSVDHIRQLHKDIELGQTPGGAAILTQRQIFLEGQKGLIDKSNLMMTHGAGKDMFADFTRMVLAKEQQYRDRNEDPSPLYNSASPEYLGNYTKYYQRSLDQSLEQKLEGLSRPPATGRIPEAPSTKEVAPYKPGESWQQYKDRTGIK